MNRRIVAVMLTATALATFATACTTPHAPEAAVSATPPASPVDGDPDDGLTVITPAPPREYPASDQSIEDACAAVLPAFNDFTNATAMWSWGGDFSREAWAEYVEESSRLIDEMRDSADNVEVKKAIDAMPPHINTADWMHIEASYSTNVDEPIKFFLVTAVLFGAVEEFAQPCQMTP